MAGLAAAAGVSEPTVMRFCNAVGCPGFQAFKLRLAQTLALGIPVTQSAVGVDDGPADLVEKLFDHSISSLDRTRRSLDRDAIAAAIDLLAEADELLFVGFGASGIVAPGRPAAVPDVRGAVPGARSTRTSSSWPRCWAARAA